MEKLIAKHVEKNPDVDIRYLAYRDLSMQNFFEKLHDLTVRATTPYVMLCENDDFIFPSGVETCIEFLEKNPDYVSCGAMIGNFTHVKKNGKNFISHVGEQYSLYSLEHETASERILAITRNYKRPTWYNVHRTEALRATLKILCDMKISDFQLMEILVSQASSLFGKHKTLGGPLQYIRQSNTSLVRANMKKMSDRINSPEFKTDASRMLSFIAEQAAKKDSKPLAEIQSRLVHAFQDYLDQGMKAKMNAPKLSPLSILKQKVYTFRYYNSLLDQWLSKREKDRLHHRMLTNKTAASASGASMAEYQRFINHFVE